MSLKALSHRALLLLRVVAKKTERDATGKLSRFYVPGRRSEHGVAGGGETGVWVYGSGDAAAFRALEGRGLIERPETSLKGKYVYALTECGAAFLAGAKK